MGRDAGRFEMDADDVLAELADDLLYHGDLNAALGRMLQHGFRDRNERRVRVYRLQRVQPLILLQRSSLLAVVLACVALTSSCNRSDDDAEAFRHAACRELVAGANDPGESKRYYERASAAAKRAAEEDVKFADLSSAASHAAEAGFREGDQRVVLNHCGPEIDEDTGPERGTP